jgi:tetratricopeptide (TPR) repeat protein
MMPHQGYRPRRSRSRAGVFASLALALLLKVNVAEAQHDVRAVELFKQSAERYREGKFSEAADLLRQAYAREPEPLLLFNLGRACESMGDAKCAIDAYTRYLLEKAPNDRGAIESRIATLKRQVEERDRLEKTAAQAGAGKPAQGEPLAPRQPSPIPWIVAGVGVVGIGVGASLGVAALHEHHDAVVDPVQKTRLDEQAKAKSLASATNVVLVAGTLVAAGGAGVGVYEVVRARKSATGASASQGQRATLSVAISPAGISLGGRF